MEQERREHREWKAEWEKDQESRISVKIQQLASEYGLQVEQREREERNQGERQNDFQQLERLRSQEQVFSQQLRRKEEQMS